MARHRAPRRRQWFRKPQPAPVETAPLPEIDEEDAAMNDELDEFFAEPATAPVARIVDLAERRPRPVGGADIVMMTRPATNAVQAVYPDGSIEDIPTELRVVATLDRITDGMVLNVTGGGRSAAIAVTHSP